MIDREIVDLVRVLIHPIVLNERMEVVDIEYRRESGGWVLRLILDEEGGITLEDCARVSREVGRSLDVEDVILTPYTLEVSSPGLTRPLKTEKDFLKFRHRLVKVKTVDPVQNRRQFKGKLLGVSENGVEIEGDGGVFQIPLSNVAKANLEIDPDVLRKDHRMK
jgi:ribosome maturation factor RimP